ncbi:MAG: pyrroline-5-carboxylate reductase [Candidatus Omnitrophota bacterium]
MKAKIIGIIGYGNMGSAIGGQLKSKYQIRAFDKDKNKTENLSGIDISDNVVDLVKGADVIVLAAKPQDFDALLSEIKQCIKGKLVISIAAGISTGYIENQLGDISVIRAMPNLPAKISKGIIALSKGSYSHDADLDFVRGLFNCLGETMLIEEGLMNAVTAVSGSGPGYLYYLIQDKDEHEQLDYANKEFIPALSLSAREIGFNPEQAQSLASRTAQGSIALLKETGLSPQELCAQVTSKGGTTEAGLNVLQSEGTLSLAVKAALKRAGELSR